MVMIALNGNLLFITFKFFIMPQEIKTEKAAQIKAAKIKAAKIKATKILAAKIKAWKNTAGKIKAWKQQAWIIKDKAAIV